MEQRSSHAYYKLALDSLAVYRQITEDKVVKSLYQLVDYLNQDKVEISTFIKLYNEFFFTFITNVQDSFQGYIIEKIIYDENPFTRNAQQLSHQNPIDSYLRKAVINDLRNLQHISELSASLIKEAAKFCFGKVEYEIKLIDTIPEWPNQTKGEVSVDEEINHVEYVKNYFRLNPNWGEGLDILAKFHKNHGSGQFARYRAFVWERINDERILRGVENPDPIKLSDLIGYEAQRAEVINNTIQLLKGYPANNVLLYGDRGTGKSSTVKAILNQYHDQGLRIIEVPKDNLVDFPLIIRDLRGRTNKFIIFVDDLAFEDNEESYTALKAVLEGGLESRPQNVIIYATSNRRHLIRETFRERSGLHSGNHEAEVHSADSVQEKLSLADRFGITAVFTSPDQRSYLEIVEGIAAQRGLDIDKEILHREALKWEMWYNGRSPRTARQFVDWLEGQN